MRTVIQVHRMITLPAQVRSVGVVRDSNTGAEVATTLPCLFRDRAFQELVKLQRAIEAQTA